MYNNTKWRASSIMLAFLLGISFFNGQSAEDLFKNYWKVGVSFERARYAANNETNASIEYRLSPVNMNNIGITWNFFQKNNHNFKASAFLPLSYFVTDYTRIRAEDLQPFDYDYIGITSVKGEHERIKANVMYEYFYPLNKNILLSAAVGPEVLYFASYRGSGSLGIGLDEYGEIRYRVLEKNDRVKNFNFGLKTEISAYFPTKIGLFQIKAEGLLAANNLEEYQVQAINLDISPDAKSKHTIKGHYVGFGVSYFLLKKKK